MPVVPVVSVVIPHWNRRELLRACLSSLERQTLAGYEAIVVDNGSTDGSAEMVLADFPQSVLIRNAENRGFCAAINQGIRQARGRYIALLNNDAEAEPPWLAELVRGAESAAGIGMCASKVMSYEHRNVIDKVGHLIYPDGQNRGRGSGEIDHGQYDREEEVLLPDGSAALYDRRVFDTAGLFDEEFFAYGDDAEMGLRARLAGWRCLYIPGAVVYHRHASTFGRFSAERLILVERNRMWLAAKLFPWSLLWRNPWYAALRWGGNAWAALSGRGEAGRIPAYQLIYCALRATAEAAMGLPHMLGKRKQVHREISDREFLDLLNRFRIPLGELVFKTHADPVQTGNGGTA
jgi:GT2 family glycosyltransferase